MKILNTAQIKDWDLYTIDEHGISSWDLMERAAKECVRWITSNLNIEGKEFCVFCGTGNNGGDGLAIARLLKEKSFPISVFIIEGSKESKDYRLNKEKLTNVEISIVKDIKELNISANPIIIDAILGSGISRPLEGLYKEVVEYINRLKEKETTIVSIDTPTGFNPDDINKEKTIVEADYTLSFSLRLGFLIKENARYLGQWQLLNIGLSESFSDKVNSKNIFLTSALIKKLLKGKSKFHNKWQNGHALLIGGSVGKAGAMVFASNGCLKAGAGLVTACIPQKLMPIIQQSVPEAMAFSKGESTLDENLSYSELEKYHAVGIGPGMGTSEGSTAFLRGLIQFVKGRLIIDADGLNILSENKTWLSHLPPGTIITPHIKEFERISGTKNEDSLEIIKSASYFAQKYNVYVVLKGAHTQIACPDGTSYFNSTGNPGMAKGGIGDTLTGIITGLLAQGYTPKDAALSGVFIHGLAADLIAVEKGVYAVNPHELANQIPSALHLLTSPQTY